jgi:hypothetical protein
MKEVSTCKIGIFAGMEEYLGYNSYCSFQT